MSLYFIISGGLPPEARKAQALLFSTPDSGYDVLVASDAIGMGLNLSIKRIVFSTIQKFDGRTKRFLDSAVRSGLYQHIFRGHLHHIIIEIIIIKSIIIIMAVIVTILGDKADRREGRQIWHSIRERGSDLHDRR
jgi:hypothetical protein